MGTTSPSLAAKLYVDRILSVIPETLSINGMEELISSAFRSGFVEGMAYFGSGGSSDLVSYSSGTVTDHTIGHVTELRYFVGVDNSGHRYLVPTENQAEWEAWVNIPEDDERSWNVPDFAKEIGGFLTFGRPDINGIRV